MTFCFMKPFEERMNKDCGINEITTDISFTLFLVPKELIHSGEKN